MRCHLWTQSRRIHRPYFRPSYDVSFFASSEIPLQNYFPRFEDGLRLVKLRGEAMQAAADASDSSMVSVIGLKAEQVRSFLSETSFHKKELL